ncbi:MAG: hypothetical protein RSC90_00955 [Clostridia bacterium]
MAKSHSESVVINTGAGFALKLIAQLLNFVTKTVFIYALGMQYTGVSTLFTDILSMLSLAELGIGSAITYALYKPIREGDAQRMAALMNFYKTAYRLIALLVLLTGAVCVPLLPYMVKGAPDIKESITLIFCLYIFSNASSYLLAYKSTLLTASERQYVISKTAICFTFARVACECFVLLVFRNFILYLLVDIVEQLLRNYVISRKADKLYPKIKLYPDAKLNKQETKHLLVDVGALALYKVAQVVLSSTDSIVISMTPALGVMAVGFLGNYRLIFTTINMTIVQFYQSFTPSLGAMASTAGSKRQYEVFETAYFISFWVVLFCTTSLLCLTEPFVRDIWLSSRYVLSKPVLFALAFNFYVQGNMRPLNAFRNSNGLFRQGKFRPLATAALNLILDFVLVQFWGVVGVLMATGLSMILTQLWYDSRLVFLKVFEKSPMIYARTYLVHLAIAVVSCGATYVLGDCVSEVVGNVYAAFVIRMGLCVVIPNGLMILLYHKSAPYRDAVKRAQMILAQIKRRALRRKAVEAPQGAVEVAQGAPLTQEQALERAIEEAEE